MVAARIDDITPPDVPVPTQYGLPYEDVVLDTEDHVKIHAFWLIQRVDLPDEASVVPSTVGMSDEEVREMCISNSCPGLQLDFSLRRLVHNHHVSRQWWKRSHRIPLAKVLYMRIRCNVLMLSYRGCVVILSLRFFDQKANQRCFKLWPFGRLAFGEGAFR